MKALVQLRGEVDRSAAVDDTLQMLNIPEVNHATLVPDTDAYRGMVTKVHDYVAYGEPSAEVLALVLERRAEPQEGRQADVDEEWLTENTEYGTFAELSEALLDGETTLREEGLSPTLRLHPPRGGHDGIKKPTGEGGQLGKHTTEQINDLLESMR